MAFATSVGMARWFKSNREAHGTAKITVFAHSLGNLALNAAMIRPELGSSKVIDTYVSYEGALAAEAFDTDTEHAAVHPVLQFHAGSMGSPDDAHWRQQFADMEAGKPYTVGENTSVATPNYEPAIRWSAKMAELRQMGVFPLPQYGVRWTQTRGANPPAETGNPDDVPQRGPWKNLFAHNREKFRMINLWNDTDFALKMWVVNNTLGKPSILAGDDQEIQAWGDMRYVNKDTATLLWSQDLKLHGNAVRQWGELAFWFVAESKPMGHACIPGIENYNFTQYGSIGDSHNYLKGNQLWQVWPAWQKVVKAMKGTSDVGCH
jgi:pimeloyl-ACP methyl ester carboxylesterase